MSVDSWVQGTREELHDRRVLGELTEETGIQCGATGAVYSDKPYGHRHPNEECWCRTSRVHRYVTPWAEVE